MASAKISWRIAAALVTVALSGVALLGAFPVALLRSVVEARLSSALETQVRLGSMSRTPWFSFSPTVSLNDLRVSQPVWAGKGDFVRLQSARLSVPVLPLLTGRFRPDKLVIDGMEVALVRLPDGRSNWNPDKRKSKGDRPSPLGQLSDLVIMRSRFSLADQKRGLAVAGQLSSNARQGLRLSGRGTFLDTPAVLDVQGASIAGLAARVPYKFSAGLESPALKLHADGTMADPLDVRHFTATVRSSAPTLKNLDRVIEAGLFGTQAFALSGIVRHEGRDWHIDRLSGRIGRSQFVGAIDVLKHDGRTAINGMVHASAFDFADLSDDIGRARAAALTARIGKRVIPNTRINLSKIGKTDGTIRFRADRLLFETDSVFRSLAATLTLDHRIVTVSAIDAVLRSGRLTGFARVDHREGAPKLALDLRFGSAVLGDIIGQPEMIDGGVRGRIILIGSGDTVRQAMAHGSGRVAMVATGGTIKATVADVLGQDLGRAIGQQIKSPNSQVPLRCLVANFSAQNGILTPNPVAIDADTAIAKANGHIALDGETIALTLGGATDRPSALRIVDPIRIGGTLSAPAIAVAGLGTSANPNAGGVLKLLGRSIKAAIGIGPKSAPSIALPSSLNCSALSAAALR